MTRDTLDGRWVRVILKSGEVLTPSGDTDKPVGVFLSRTDNWVVIRFAKSEYPQLEIPISNIVAIENVENQ